MTASPKNNTALLVSFFLLFSTISLLKPNYEYLVILSFMGVISTSYLFINYTQILFKYKSDLAITAFLFGLLFWFWKEILFLIIAPISFLDLVSYSPFSDRRIPVEIVSNSIFVLASFTFTTFFSWKLFRSFKFPSLALKKFEANPLFIEFSLFIFSILGWIPFAKHFGGLQESIVSLLSFRAEEFEIEPGLVNYLPIVSIVAASFSLTRLLNNISKNKWLCILAFIAGGSIAFLSGTRFKLIYLVLPSLLSLIVTQDDTISRRKKILLFSAIGILLLGFAFYQIVNRYGEDSFYAESGLMTATAGADHFSALTHAVALAEQLPDYFKQPMLPLFISDLIPRMFWPEKPVHLYWEYFNSKLAIAGNITPSVLGQYYLNWGIFGGIIAGINFGLWSAIADRHINIYRKNRNFLHIILSTFIISFLFLSFRVYSLNYFFYLLILYFLCYLFSRNYRKC